MYKYLIVAFLCFAIVLVKISLLPSIDIVTLAIVLTMFYFDSRYALSLAWGAGFLSDLFSPWFGISIITYLFVYGVCRIISKNGITDKSFFALQLLGLVGVITALGVKLLCSIILFFAGAQILFPVFNQSFFIHLLFSIGFDAVILTFLYFGIGKTTPFNRAYIIIGQ